jgi:cation diffusion facilitator family transporter
MNPSKDIRGLQMTLGVYCGIFALKLAAYFASGVLALFAEAMHTFSDIFVSGFLLIALYYSRRSADRVHMFGYGRAQNVAALVAATLFISFTSYELYREAIPHLFSPTAKTYQHLPVALGVLAVSMLIACIPLITLFRQKTRGAVAHAQFMELLNDEMGLLAALLGTVGVALGYPVADPLASIVIATIIAANAVGLFRENLSLLIGRSPDPEHMERIRTAALETAGVRGVHELRAEFVGPDSVHADMHIEVQRGLPVEEATLIAESVMERVRAAASVDYCSIHADAHEIAEKESSASPVA